MNSFMAALRMIARRESPVGSHRQHEQATDCLHDGSLPICASCAVAMGFGIVLDTKTDRLVSPHGLTDVGA